MSRTTVVDKWVANECYTFRSADGRSSRFWKFSWNQPPTLLQRLVPWEVLRCRRCSLSSANGARPSCTYTRTSMTTHFALFDSCCAPSLPIAHGTDMRNAAKRTRFLQEENCLLRGRQALQNQVYSLSSTKT